MEIIKLNLIPSGATPVVHVKQYDIGRTWRFELYEGAAVYTLDGTEVLECDVKKLDGNVVTISVTNTSSTYVDIETTVQMTACSGEQIGALRITKGGDDIATINFILACQRSPLEGGITSDSAIHNLEQQIADAVADQYDADSVIFDNTPTTGHGIGYAVTSDGLKSYIPKNVSDMDDVTITTPVPGEALVFDNDGNLVNGTVSTVGNLDDLSDVDTTGKAVGDSLRYDGVEWIAQPTTVALTQAEYDALQLSGDLVPNTHYVITDAPNLNPTASDIEYSGAVTVKQAIDSKANKTETLYQVGDTVSGIFYMSGFVGGNNIIYVMPQFKKALSDSINGLNITIQNDNKITIYRINGDILTTSATSTGVYGLANGFRININYPNNTFDNSLLGTPIYIACTLSITFT